VGKIQDDNLFVKRFSNRIFNLQQAGMTMPMTNKLQWIRGY